MAHEHEYWKIITRKCKDCANYTQSEDGGICHLTPRKREADPEYWCAHGSWYEGWNYEAEMPFVCGSGQVWVYRDKVEAYKKQMESMEENEILTLMKRGVDDALKQQ